MLFEYFGKISGLYYHAFAVTQKGELMFSGLQFFPPVIVTASFFPSYMVSLFLSAATTEQNGELSSLPKHLNHILLALEMVLTLSMGIQEM